MHISLHPFMVVSSVEVTVPCFFMLQHSLIRKRTYWPYWLVLWLSYYSVYNWLWTMTGKGVKNKSIIQECNVWGSSTREEFEHPCPSSLWWHCTLNVLWCLFSSTPILCSDWGLKSTEDGHLEKFPGSVVPQISLVGLLRNSARERQSREHYTNKDVSVFQASDT